MAVVEEFKSLLATKQMELARAEDCSISKPIIEDEIGNIHDALEVLENDALDPRDIASELYDIGQSTTSNRVWQLTMQGYVEQRA